MQKRMESENYFGKLWVVSRLNLLCHKSTLRAKSLFWTLGKMDLISILAVDVPICFSRVVGEKDQDQVFGVCVCVSL